MHIPSVFPEGSNGGGYYVRSEHKRIYNRRTGVCFPDAEVHIPPVLPRVFD